VMAAVLFRGRLRRKRDNQNSEDECDSFHPMTSLRDFDIRNARNRGLIHYKRGRAAERSKSTCVLLAWSLTETQQPREHHPRVSA